jgi:ATP-binding cassette subfamily B protein
VDVELRVRALGASLTPAGISHLEDPELRAVFGSTRNLSPFAFTPGDAAQNLPFSLAMRLQTVFALVVVATYEPLLALVALVLWLVVQLLLVANVIGTTASSAIGILPEEVQYYRELVLSRGPAQEVRIFGLAGWLSSRFTTAAHERLVSARIARKGRWRSYVAAATLSGVGLAGGFLWVGTQGADGALSITGVAVVAAMVLRIFTVPNVIADVPIAYGMFAIPAIEAAEASSISSVQDGGAPVGAAPTESIALRDVSFRYPGATEPVLHGLDLTIPAGQRLAVVGLNGSGKTTLIKLLCRLYDPTTGTISVDGTDLQTFDPAAWRAQLAVLFQDYVHYQLSARDNVWLDAPADGGNGTVRLTRAVAAAGATDILEGLPDGWETPLSAGRTDGVDLSGGQWQRVALARAMYAIDAGARLLVLDEPTANLDPRGEQELFDAVLDSPLVRGDGTGHVAPVTTILVSHRFATVRHADRIVVLEEGHVIEDGDHDALVAAGGRYAELFDAQAATFRDGAR